MFTVGAETFQKHENRDFKKRYYLILVLLNLKFLLNLTRWNQWNRHVHIEACSRYRSIRRGDPEWRRYDGGYDEESSDEDDDYTDSDDSDDDGDNNRHQ